MSARYRKVSKIADGGMAEIFLAVQHGAEGFERRVVLKQILAALLADPKFRNLLVDEALVAMSLNHSNIVQVLDLGQSKGRYFLVLELVDGWDLNRIIGRVRSTLHALAPELALYIVAEVCRALSYAHGQTRGGEPLGIVHRDVSPHNVLISEQGEVKLTDFGIAKALGRRERTVEGVIKGKLAFMSPEQASGLELDARSDLFSVGTMLYLLVVGRRPFESPTDLETILRVQQCQFPGPREARPDLPAPIADIIERAMQRDPGQRYQTAEEMLLDLESAQRSVFRPAGQTELKRWLIALGDKDHLLPTSRAVTPAPAAEMEEIDLHEDIVFEEISVAVGGTRGATSASVIRAADAFRAQADPPPGLTRPDTQVPPVSPLADGPYRIPSPLSFPTLPSRRRWLVGGLITGAALTAGALAAIRMRSGDLGLLVDGWLREAPRAAPPAPPVGPGREEVASSSPAPAPAPAPAEPAAPPPGSDPAEKSPGSDPAAPAAEKPGSDPAAASPPEPGSGPVAEGAAQDPASPPSTEPGTGPAMEPAAEAGAEAAPEPGSEEEDEEALLKRQEPDIADKVIGPEEGEKAPEKVAEKATEKVDDGAADRAEDRGEDRAEDRAEGRSQAKASSAGNARGSGGTATPVAARRTESPAPSRRASSTPAPAPTRRVASKEPASVRIESRPDGAVVKLGSRVFGRAPLNLRFNPGVTYELTFVKQGFESTRKRFTASGRKGQRVAVSLKKKAAAPPKRKSFFQKILGGFKR